MARAIAASPWASVLRLVDSSSQRSTAVLVVSHLRPCAPQKFICHVVYCFV